MRVVASTPSITASRGEGLALASFYSKLLNMSSRGHIFILLFLAIFGLPTCVRSTYSTLKCYQCAVTKGDPSLCPRDAVLFELTGWDACMTWKLSNGTTILQNFVHKEVDCTPRRLSYWQHYMNKVWNEDGIAECCYDNECNGLRPEQESGYTHLPAEVDFGENGPGEFMACSDCASIENTICDNPKDDEDMLIDANDPGNVPETNRVGGTFLNRRPLFSPQLRQVSPSHSNSLVKSLIASSSSIRIEFSKMVASMSDDRGYCRCADGFLPLMGNGSLLECHDPIIRSAVVGSRCLVSSHCQHLNNTSCAEDEDLQDSSGISTYMSCQCLDGFQVSDDLLGCVAETAEEEATEALLCFSDDDCQFLLDNSRCNIANNETTDMGRCICMEGYVPIFNISDANNLVQCRDPIVLTSTVNGLCFNEDHCRFLTGTECRTVNETSLKTCQCQEGYKPDEEDPLTGLITRCLRLSNDTTRHGSLGFLAINGEEQEDEEETIESFDLPDYPSLITAGLEDFEDIDMFLEHEPMDILAIMSDPTLSQRGPSSCREKATVVERNEWIPKTSFKMTQVQDNPETRLAVVFARIPVTAGDSDGLLLRLSYSGSPGDSMYSIRVLKNRQVVLGKGFLVDNEQTENMQVVNSSTTARWLNNKEYTGFWIVYNKGFIAIGVLDESTVESPIIRWRDSDFIPGIDTIGLSALGSGVFYRFGCSFSSSFPDSICSVDEDCRHLANTECRPRSVDGEDDVVFQSCQCQPGFQTIPRVRRTFVGGCYDPIVRASTLNGPCLDNVHCQDLPNTVCEINPFQNNERQCVCASGARPLERDSATGLIPGCTEPDTRLQAPSIETCRRRFSVQQRRSWIPNTLLSTEYDEMNLMYRARFFLRFSSERTVASIKLVPQSRNPRKFYKVTISGTGTISIYENRKSREVLLGSRNEERLQISKTFGTRGLIQTEFCGFWITYQPNLGRISVGQTAERFPLLQWTDASPSRLEDTRLVGFGAEQGANVEVGAVCS